MSFLRHHEIYRSDVGVKTFLACGPRNASLASARNQHKGRGLYPAPHPIVRDESRVAYSLVGCSPAEPASASPAGIYAGPTGRNSQPPPNGGWGIFARRFGEFSTGVDI